ncbi:MAG: hypothetical protein AAGI03_06840 [Pseudomonadota bacterium]
MLTFLSQPFAITTPEVPLWQALLAVYLLGLLTMFTIGARSSSYHSQAEGILLAVLSILWPVAVPFSALYRVVRIGRR